MGQAPRPVLHLVWPEEGDGKLRRDVILCAAGLLGGARRRHNGGGGPGSAGEANPQRGAAGCSAYCAVQGVFVGVHRSMARIQAAREAAEAGNALHALPVSTNPAHSCFVLHYVRSKCQEDVHHCGRSQLAPPISADRWSCSLPGAQTNLLSCQSVSRSRVREAAPGLQSISDRPLSIMDDSEIFGTSLALACISVVTISLPSLLFVMQAWSR